MSKDLIEEILTSIGLERLEDPNRDLTAEEKKQKNRR
ncbi:hypothetical protein JOC37_002510 [Desulfohalotomaculum tongense]|nr:hypothetical protein [Desulforadius tongensis]